MRFRAMSKATSESVAFRTAFSLALCVALGCLRNSFVAGAEKQAAPVAKAAPNVSRLQELDEKMREFVPLIDQAIAKGRFNEAARLTHELIDLQTQRYGAENWRVRHSEVLRESYSRIGQLPPKDQDRVTKALAMTRVAGKLVDESRFAEISSLFKEATKTLAEVVGPADVHTLDSELRYAGALSDLGEVDQAKQIAINVVKLRRNLAGDESAYHAYSMRYLGAIYLKAGMLAEAEEQLRLADKLFLKLYGGTVPDRILTLATLVVALVDAKKFAEAEPLARESVRLAAFRMKEEPKLYIQTRMYVAHCLHGRGKLEAAAKEFAEVMTIVDRFKASTEYLIDVIGRYVVILDAAGRVQEAAKYKERLSKLKEQMAAEQRVAEETLAPPPE